MTKSTLIIAEAGVNHNGSLALAFELVDKAVDAGVDIVKFQTFVAEHLVTESAEQAAYQAANIGKKKSQLDMLKQLELTFDEHKQLQAYCDRKGIQYLSTAFDLQSLTLLADEMNIDLLKIPSGELTNAPYLLAHAQKRKPLIVSTGMADLNEVKQALSVLAFGLTHEISEPATHLSLAEFSLAFDSSSGQEALKKHVTLLHCTTEYPAPLSSINLDAMSLMAETFALPVGYSDHSEGLLVSQLAVAKGACVIEKHFTLSREMEGPDHKASIEPDELNDMVRLIRQVEVINGSRQKEPSICELKNIPVARKSLVAEKFICAGELFTAENIAIKRPGTGVSPMHYWQILGKNASKDYAPGELIDIKEN
mgnify:CR=1 FL=1